MIKGVQKIKAFKTTDNQLFEEEGEADHHQFKLNQRELIEIFINEYAPLGSMTREDVIELLVQNIDRLTIYAMGE